MATARTQVSGPGTEGPKVFSAAAAPAVDNDKTNGVDVGDLWVVPGSATNAVQKLNFTDSSGSGTFTLTCEGITTGAITYSATAATLVGNINTALNAAFGTSQIVASGTLITNISITFSGSNFASRPVGAITAGTGSLTGATLQITSVTTGAAGAAVYICSNNATSAAVWDRLGRVSGISVSQLVDATGGTAAGTLTVIAAGGSYSQTDMQHVQNNLASLAAKQNAIIGILKAAGMAA